MNGPAPSFTPFLRAEGLRHVLSCSGGKDSTALYLLAVERGVPFNAVFADTGNEHELTLEYIDALPRLTGGPPVKWVRADFADQFERKRRYIAAQWPADLMAGSDGAAGSRSPRARART